MVGSIMDCWQNALEDVGPAGVDKGNGGKYLIIPPGYKEKIPDGYIQLPSDTYQGYALLRSVLNSGSEADIAKAIAYAKRIRLYPLSQGANPQQTKFVDAIKTIFDATITYDLRFFQSLDRMASIWSPLRTSTDMPMVSTPYSASISLASLSGRSGCASVTTTLAPSIA